MESSRLADKIYQLRTERRIQQKTVAKAIGINPPMYSRVEKGERRIKPEQLEKLADFFQVDKEELFSLWLADKVCEATNGVPPTVAQKAISIINEELE